MSQAEDPLKAYGHIPRDRIEVSKLAVMSVDLRAETGCPHVTQDESIVLEPPHPFVLSVLGPTDGEHPIAEIRFWFSGREVVLVGQLTQRQAIFEVTPDILVAARDDEGYLTQLRNWLGLAA
jgi:hypothetical protein